MELGDETKKMFLNAKGTIGKVEKDIDSFLAYVDGKAAEGKFTKDIASEVNKVKQHNETKVEYMTLMMELKQQRREGREEGREEGRKEGENKLAKLISCLLSSGKADDVELAVKDIDKREQLYVQYGIS